MKELRPNYYKNKRGHDLFWKMETRCYPYDWCIGFCELNIKKYEMRLGEKTRNTTLDKRKIATYQAEISRLKERKRALDEIGEAW